MSKDNLAQDNTQSQNIKEAEAHVNEGAQGAKIHIKEALSHAGQAAQDVKNHGYEAAQRVKDHGVELLHESTERVRERGRHYYEDASARVELGCEATANKVKESPLKALGIAAAVGFLFGALSKSKGHRARRY